MKNLVKFNVKNIKYAVQNADGTYGAPVAYGSSRAITLEAETNIKDIFGDGVKIASIVNDKGKSGSFTTNAISNEYEIAMARKMLLENGVLADIKQTKSVPHAIYFETEGLDEATGAVTTAKTWLYNCTSSRPSESYEQTEDDTKESTFETKLSIKGVKILDENDQPYHDENGNEIYAWQVTADKDSANFATFGDAVYIPVAPASQTQNPSQGTNEGE